MKNRTVMKFGLGVFFLLISVVGILFFNGNKENRIPDNGIYLLNNIGYYAFGNMNGKISTTLGSYKKAYDRWETTRPLYVLPTIGNKDGEMYDPFAEEEEKKNKSLYLVFNQKGGIYADFNYFIPETYELNKVHNFKKYQYNYIKINGNYIKENKIVDENNNVIRIDEKDKEKILLVPAKYRNIEQKVKDYYNDILFEEPGSGKVKIIWVKDGQKYFL